MSIEETKESVEKCCRFGGKHKKFLVMSVFFIVLVIAIMAIVAGSKANGNRSKMLGNSKYPNMMEKRGYAAYPSYADDMNQFITPEDALKTGEVAIVVEDLDSAKKAVNEIAAKNNGNVYATFISYASAKSKNGSIVVQVPVGNFDAAFGMLKGVGSKVIQESMKQVPPRNIYPMMLPASGQEKAAMPVADDAPEINATDEVVSSSSASASEIAPMIYPAPQQVLQDKGYVRVVFVDYGNQRNMMGGVSEKFDSSQNLRVLWIALGLKLFLLVILFVILLVMLRRIFRSFREARSAKKAVHKVHVVRQMPKTRQRVVRIAKKK